MSPEEEIVRVTLQSNLMMALLVSSTALAGLTGVFVGFTAQILSTTGKFERWYLTICGGLFFIMFVMVMSNTIGWFQTPERAELITNTIYWFVGQFAAFIILMIMCWVIALKK